MQSISALAVRVASPNCVLRVVLKRHVSIVPCQFDWCKWNDAELPGQYRAFEACVGEFDDGSMVRCCFYITRGTCEQKAISPILIACESEVIQSQKSQSLVMQNQGTEATRQELYTLQTLRISLNEDRGFGELGTENEKERKGNGKSLKWVILKCAKRVERAQSAKEEEG